MICLYYICIIINLQDLVERSSLHRPGHVLRIHVSDPTDVRSSARPREDDEGWEPRLWFPLKRVGCPPRRRGNVQLQRPKFAVRLLLLKMALMPSLGIFFQDHSQLPESKDERNGESSLWPFSMT